MYIRSPPPDLLERWRFETAEVFGSAPGAPTGGCDPPQPASIAAAALIVSAQRLKPRILISIPLVISTDRRGQWFGAASKAASAPLSQHSLASQSRAEGQRRGAGRAANNCRVTVRR